MTDETRKNTIIIASFAFKKVPQMFDCQELYSLCHSYTPINDMEFHYSWDWLIPAWIKVYREYCRTRQDIGGVRSSNHVDEFFELTKKFNTAVNNNNITEAFKLVVETIKTFK